MVSGGEGIVECGGSGMAIGFCIQREQVIDVGVEAELRTERETGLGGEAAGGFVEEVADGDGQGGDVVGVGEDTAMAGVGHDFAGTIEDGADDGDAHGEGFEDDKAARIVARGEDEEIGGAIEGVGVGGWAGEDDAVGDADFAGELKVGSGVVFADDDKGEWVGGDIAQRENGLAEAFAGEVLCDGEGEDAFGAELEAAAEVLTGGGVAGGVEALEIDGIEEGGEAGFREGVVLADGFFDVLGEAEDDRAGRGGEELAFDAGEGAAFGVEAVGGGGEDAAWAGGVFDVAGGDGVGSQAGMGVVEVAGADGEHGVYDVVGLDGEVRVEVVEEAAIGAEAGGGAGVNGGGMNAGGNLGEGGGDQGNVVAA
jgi:hypothetical protein